MKIKTLNFILACLLSFSICFGFQMKFEAVILEKKMFEIRNIQGQKRNKPKCYFFVQENGKIVSVDTTEETYHKFKKGDRIIYWKGPYNRFVDEHNKIIKGEGELLTD